MKLFNLPFQKNFRWLGILLLVFLFSCSRPKSPEYLGFEIVDLKSIDSDNFKLSVRLKLHNPNPYPFHINLVRLQVIQLKEETLEFINSVEDYDFSKLIVSNQLVISELDTPDEIVLDRNADSNVDLNLMVNKKNLWTSALSLLFEKKIHLLFKGDFIFHHWSGEYKVPFATYQPMSLKQLIDL